MMQGLYIGANGLKTHGEGMNIVSNNIANVSTVGFKQQQWLFEDMMYQQLSLGNSMGVVSSSKGLGSMTCASRTLHTESAFEISNTATDLALTGKGFFEVSDEQGNNFYTRAGNFRFDYEGVLRNPGGLAVTGIPITNGVESGGMQPLQIDTSDAKVAIDQPKATESILAALNINASTDVISDTADPYFSLVSAWNGTSSPPLSSTDHSQALTVYDSNGNAQNVTIHFDGAPSGVGGQKVLEFIVTMDPELDGRAGIADTSGAGLLMAGTMTFSSSGELVNMSAFTPSGTDLKDLNNWTLADIQDGTLQLPISFSGQPAQTVGFNIGASGSGWNNSVSSAADIGTDLLALPAMANVTYNATGTTSLPVSSALISYDQDGYPTGHLYDVQVGDDGVMTAYYSNGQSHDLYRIPVVNFTSEDGLRREGNNLFSQTKEAGEIYYGEAGTENFSSIQGNHLETSNVDMSKEMVNMIIMQRGFQSNSKSITTLDTMIQKAIELKR